MDRQDLLNTFELEQQTAFHEYVKSQRFIKDQAFVLYPDEALIDGSDLAQFQFAHQAAFIDAFDQTRSFQTVNLNGGADSEAAQIVRFGEKRMHKTFVHQANEENEVICAVPRALAPRANNIFFTRNPRRLPWALL